MKEFRNTNSIRKSIFGIKNQEELCSADRHTSKRNPIIQTGASHYTD